MYWGSLELTIRYYYKVQWLKEQQTQGFAEIYDSSWLINKSVTENSSLLMPKLTCKNYRSSNEIKLFSSKRILSIFKQKISWRIVHQRSRYFIIKNKLVYQSNLARNCNFRKLTLKYRDLCNSLFDKYSNQNITL
jgi:hypothetical protein